MTLLYSLVVYIMLSSVCFLRRKSFPLNLFVSFFLVYVTYQKYSYDLYTYLLYLSIFFVLHLISISDMRTRRIPNMLVFFLLLIMVIYNGNRYMITKDMLLVFKPVIAMVCILVLFGILSSVFKNSIGGGDIKLLAVLALMASFDKMLLLLFISSVLSILYILGLCSAKKIKSRRDKIAFGPFICLAFFIIYIWF